MIEGACRAGFLLESPQAIRIRRERDGQDFDRDVSSEARIARPVDLPHPAGAERGENLVRTKARGGGEAHAGGPHCSVEAAEERGAVAEVSIGQPVETASSEVEAFRRDERLFPLQ